MSSIGSARARVVASPLLALVLLTACAGDPPPAANGQAEVSPTPEPQPSAAVATPPGRNGGSGTRTSAGPTATMRTFSGTVTARPRAPQPTTAAPAAVAVAASGAVLLEAVELQPEDLSPGGQLVVLRNTGRRAVSVDCWTVRSGSGSSARIRINRPLEPGQRLRLLPETPLFNSTDSVFLIDAARHVVDRTPELTDTTGDDQLWFRAASGEWRFGRDQRPSGTTTDARLVNDTC